jgi:dTDP-4-dehydrorhamnose reductase
MLVAFPEAVVARLPSCFYGNSFGAGAAPRQPARVARQRHPTMLFTDEWRTPLEVSTAARALVELLEKDVRGILHSLGPDRISRYDLGLTVIDASRLSRGRLREQIRPGNRAEGKQASRPSDVPRWTPVAPGRSRDPAARSARRG